MVKVKITKHVEVKKTQPEAQPQAQEGQGVCEGEGDIVFANSKKSKLFECEEMKGKCVDAVGGTNGALGPRLEKAGICNANDLTCKMRGMTKRKYLRYIMKETGCNVRLAMDSYVSVKSHCENFKDYKCRSKKR